MISKGKSKTATETQWLSDVLEFAQNSSWLRDMYGTHCGHVYAFQIDHIIGAQAKRKVYGVTTKAGEFAIMPIPVEIHDITSNHPLNRTLKPKAYRDVFGHETQVWRSMLDAMVLEGYELPFENELIEAVMR